MKNNQGKIWLSLISIFLITALTAGQNSTFLTNEQPTYTPKPTYTAYPTYTPQGTLGATITPTPLPTSTPYGQNPSSTQNPATESLSFEDEFRSFYESNPSLADDYRFGEFFRGNRVMNGEKGYCFSIDSIYAERRFGEICWFLDGMTSLANQDRLQPFEISSAETHVENAPEFGDFSTLVTGNESGEQYFRGGAVFGAWVIGFQFSAMDEVNVPIEIGKVFNSIFQQVNPSISQYHDADIIKNDADPNALRIIQILTSFSLDDLLEEYSKGEPQFSNFGGFSSEELTLIYANTDINAGMISIYPYNNYSIDHYQTTFDVMEFEPRKPIITGGEIIGDRSVMFKSDANPAGEMIVQRFQKYDLFVEVRLMNHGSDTVKDAREIAKRIAELISPPEIESFRPIGNVLEQQLMNCFPAQGDLGLDRNMYQFTWSTDMMDHGIQYSTRYTDFRGYNHWGPVGILFINMTAFVTPMTGQDIPVYWENEYSILLDHQQYTDIGDRSEGWFFKNTYNRPQTYDSSFYFQKGNILVEIGFGEIVENDVPQQEDILNVMLEIARKMDQCLPENPVLPTSMSMPSDIKSDVVKDGVIEIIDIRGSDQEENPTSDGLTVVPIPAEIHFYIHEQLDAPLTLAIYNPEHDLYTYRKQEKVIPPLGDYFSILRTEGYSTFIEGINELHVWSGDQLILVYPLVLSSSWGERSSR